MPSTQRSASSRCEVDSSRIDSSRLRAITGIATLSSKLPLAPATVTAASLPITWAQTISVASGSTGLTLPGMMLDPGCRSGRWISARPVVGPEDIQRRSLQILVRPTAMVLQHAAELDEGVAGALGLEVVARLGELLAGGLGEHLDHPGGEPGRGVDAGADGGAAQRQLADPGEHAVEPLGGVPHRGGVPAELLAEHHRRGVHQVGAAGLHQAGELVGLGGQAALERRRARAAGPRPRRASAATWIEVGKVSLLDWLALTWSLGCTSTPARRGEAGEHLVHVHVGAGARAGLEDVEREVRRRARRCAPRSAAASIASACSASRTPSSPLTRAAPPSPAPARGSCRGSRVVPLIGKFSTARWVCARHSASVGHPDLAHGVVLDPESSVVGLMPLDGTRADVEPVLLVAVLQQHVVRRVPSASPNTSRSASSSSGAGAADQITSTPPGRSAARPAARNGAR